MWKHVGRARPPFAIEPGPGQESVWDYPRPPALVADPRHVEVCVGEVHVGEVHADVARLVSTHEAVRVLETASPPTFYLPPGDVEMAMLVRHPGRSFCEWKGEASYWALEDDPSTAIGWSYRAPREHFGALADYLAFYPSKLRCRVGGETVTPQAGDFYGGWITPEVVGPFKGDPGTGSW